MINHWVEMTLNHSKMRFSQRNTFIIANRTTTGMESIPYTNPVFWATVLIGGLLLCALSAAITYYQNKDTEEPVVNLKGLVRDAILGSIFTAMGWALVPESFESVANTVSSSVSTTVSSVSTNTLMKGGTPLPSVSADFDLQVGPAMF